MVCVSRPSSCAGQTAPLGTSPLLVLRTGRDHRAEPVPWQEWGQDARQRPVSSAKSPRSPGRTPGAASGHSLTSPRDRSKGCVSREPMMVGRFGLGRAQVSGDSQAVLTPSCPAPCAVGREPGAAESEHLLFSDSKALLQSSGERPPETLRLCWRTWPLGSKRSTGSSKLSGPMPSLAAPPGPNKKESGGTSRDAGTWGWALEPIEAGGCRAGLEGPQGSGHSTR